ncbi:hypothetical protein MHTCC0001_00170 [Flavobacteriaceae bacterium MHTCC 0001]
MENGFLDFFNYYILYTKIPINRDDFKSEFKSHPEYPSIMAISDTLKLFDIESATLKVDKQSLLKLPDIFASELILDEGHSFYFVKKDNTNFIVYSHKKKITYSIEQFQKLFTGIVFLIDSSQAQKVKKPSFESFNTVGITFVFVLILLNFILHKGSVKDVFFLLFPFLGLYLSINALKDVFNISDGIIDKYCNKSPEISCESVLNSKKWKLLKILNFSDLSLVFFSFQIIIFVFSYNNDLNTFFSFQSIVILMTIPIILLSVYYQKFIEKKWCTICLLIISVLIFEILYFALIKGFSIYAIYDSSTLILISVFLILYVSWNKFKKTVLINKGLLEQNYRLNRFYRNYKWFRQELLSSDKIFEVKNSSPILCTSSESKNIKFTLILSPFCNHCKETFQIIEKLMHKYDLNVDIYLNHKKNNEQEKNIVKYLIGEYLIHGNEKLLDELRSIYVTSNYSKKNYFLSDSKINSFYDSQRNFLIKNNITRMPKIYINNFNYPDSYRREDLKYFMQDLMNDLLQP